MCGRFALASESAEIVEKFDIRKISCDFKPDWNISPGQYIPVVIHREDQNILESFLWGLIPSWAKDPSIGQKLINARAETIHQKPSFKNAFMNRRCLIVADGFYEWKKDGSKKIPLYFFLKSGEPFGIAGLYETWVSPEKKRINTCTIVTTDANKLIQPAHDRMPVIIPKEREQTWLSNEIENRTILLPVLKPYPAEEMAYKVGMGPTFS